MPLQVGSPDIDVFKRYKTFGDITNEADQNALAQELTRAQIMQAQSKAAFAAKGGDRPSAVQVYEYVKNLAPTEQDLFFKTQRADKIIDTGGNFSRFDPTTNSAQNIPGSNKTLAPAQTIPYLTDKVTAEQAAMPTKPLTEAQANAGIFADRMLKSNDILGGLEKVGTDLGQRAKANIPLLGNYAVSEDYQKFDQAQRDFLNAVLRKESGAAISPSEFENGKKQYFPQPGDGPEVLQQKAANRATAITAIQRAVGPTYAAPIDGPNPAININPQSAAAVGFADPNETIQIPVKSSLAEQSKQQFNSRNLLTTPSGIQYKVIK